MTPCKPDLDRVVAETFVARAEYDPVLGSTNDRARQCADRPAEALPLLIVAGRQTAGRGRGGHRWWTGAGSLAMSLVLEPAEPHARSAGSTLLGLAAAVALVDTVAPLLAGQAAGLHWPNDVFAAGRKLAGVLVEAPAHRRRIVGIGLNTNSRLADAPADLQATATTLWELTGEEHDHTEILITLLRHLEAALRQLASSPEQLGTRAGRLCLQTGKTLTVRLGQSEVTGRCAGIAPDGALLLETPAGMRKFYSGTLV
jgi:BirA family biotin operon repressor/biotin-[acetyl-CoA-carboxylase] ligase